MFKPDIKNKETAYDPWAKPKGKMIFTIKIK